MASPMASMATDRRRDHLQLQTNVFVQQTKTKKRYHQCIYSRAFPPRLMARGQCWKRTWHIKTRRRKELGSLRISGAERTGIDFLRHCLSVVQHFQETKSISAGRSQRSSSSGCVIFRMAFVRHFEMKNSSNTIDGCSSKRPELTVSPEHPATNSATT